TNEVYEMKADGSLTAAEKTQIFDDSRALLMEFPKLPAGDQAKLRNWMDLCSPPISSPIDSPAGISTSQSSTAPTTGEPIEKSTNPYMKPSILAIIAPILMDISKIMIDIVKQS